MIYGGKPVTYKPQNRPVRGYPNNPQAPVSQMTGGSPLLYQMHPQQTGMAPPSPQPQAYAYAMPQQMATGGMPQYQMSPQPQQPPQAYQYNQAPQMPQYPGYVGSPQGVDSSQVDFLVSKIITRLAVSKAASDISLLRDISAMSYGVFSNGSLTHQALDMWASLLSNLNEGKFQPPAEIPNNFQPVEEDEDDEDNATLDPLTMQQIQLQHQLQLQQMQLQQLQQQQAAKSAGGIRRH